MSLQGHATIFSMEINGVETLVILQNQNFLAQLISEGMKIPMEFFCKPNVGGKCFGPLAPPVTPSFIQTMQTLWNLPHHFSPFPNMTNLAQTPFFTPPELIRNNPILFPWQSIPTPQHPPLVIPTPGAMNLPSPQDQEEVKAPPMSRNTSFTEISNFKNVALMIFPKGEDKKYIHLCLPTLVKFSFNLHPSINTTLAKYAVVLTPTMNSNLTPSTGSSEIPSLFYSSMYQPTSIIMWNTRGVNNDNFKRNFKNLIQNYNPCMVALLETKMVNHQGMLNEFGFDDFWETAAHGRSGGIILLWHTSIITITRKNQTSQELHAMMQVCPLNLPCYFSIIYASTIYSKRMSLWNNLKDIANSYAGPWLIASDFNEILSQKVKWEGGGSPPLVPLKALTFGPVSTIATSLT
ncbi:hypothetical protein KY289_010724 [Solanum tuberosum]|nr:hypothetical protein KY289_010724 [Solanum tuberosum]